METYTLSIIALTLLFSGFFSGMEIAFVSSNKLRIELDKKRGSFSGKVLSFFVTHQSNYLSTMLLGNNIALVVYGMSMALLLEPILYEFFPSDVSVFVLQTILSTLLLLVAAEFLPKVIFRIDPNKTLNVFAIPTITIYILLFPIVWLTQQLSKFVIERLFHQKMENTRVVFGKVDLYNYVREITSAAKTKEDIDNEVQIFQNALDFSKTKVRECMVPRNEVTAFDYNGTTEELRNLFHESGHSRVLVYKDNIDNIVGYAHAFEMFKKPIHVKDVLIPISIVPESMPLNKALTRMNRRNQGIALVVDEYGGTSGIITLEDIIEEIVGDIEDEHDTDDQLETQVNDFVYEFSGRLDIDYINEKYELNLPEADEYNTLAGLLISRFESIPEAGQSMYIDDYKFDILKVGENKIDEVKVTKLHNED